MRKLLRLERTSKKQQAEKSSEFTRVLPPPRILEKNLEMYDVLGTVLRRLLS